MKKMNLKGKNGMTLLEVVISVAILSLLAVFIISVFGSSLNIISGNADLKKSCKDAASGIESKMSGIDADEDTSVVYEDNGIFRVVFNNTSIDSEGSFIRSSDIDSKARFYYFNPD